MDSLKGATLVKADGSQVKAEVALENKVGYFIYFRKKIRNMENL